MARGLASRQSGMVAVLLNDLHNPFFAETFDGLVDAAESLGYRLLLGAGSARRQAELVAMRGFLEYRPDGIILLSPRLPIGAIAAVAATVPMVVVGRHVRAAGVDSVMTDEEVGARLVVDHLAELGHERIVHIDGGRGAGAAPRRQGYRKAMDRAGLEPLHRGAARRLHRARRDHAAAASCRRRRLPTAVFAANDLVAIGAIDTLERNGHEVPGAVSVVGYDNTFFARLRHVSLTTVDQPREEMGRLALGLLVDRMLGRRGRPEARADHADPRHPRHDCAAPRERSTSSGRALVRAGRRPRRRRLCRRRPTGSCVGRRGPAAGCSPVDRTSSGVVVADGYVLTTAHGVRGATTVSADGTPAVVVAVDRRIDAALLAVATSGPPIETAVDAVPGNARLDGRPVVVERLVVVSIDEPLDGATYRRRALVIDGEVTTATAGRGSSGRMGDCWAWSSRHRPVMSRSPTPSP